METEIMAPRDHNKVILSRSICHFGPISHISAIHIHVFFSRLFSDNHNVRRMAIDSVVGKTIQPPYNHHTTTS